MSTPSIPILTVGHSTRSLPEFVALLRNFDVRRLVDIRTVPHSRHNPQFDQETLAAGLGLSGVAYFHAAGLGGLRRPRADSTNLGWRNLSFRGYADHMATPEFERALLELIRGSNGGVTVVMCAEAVPWRCHRSLLADALILRGIPVRHMMKAGSATTHRLSAWCFPVDGRPTYPSAAGGSTLEDFDESKDAPPA